jgi:xylose isomerase
VLEEAGYGSRGEFIGLDVKAMRTQKGSCVTDHLKNSREIFMHLVNKVRTWDRRLEQQYIDARDYEALELAVLKHIMGVK